ncbi:MAG: helix-turn-helix domain-containing protein [Candidatus Dormibacteria bacterium]
MTYNVGVDYASLIRRERQAAGLSQEELGRRARTSQSAVARYELGQMSPTTRTLSRLLATCRAARRPERRAPSELWVVPARDSDDLLWLPTSSLLAGLETQPLPPKMVIAARWRARGVDVARLLDAIRLSPNQRLNRLEGFVSDMQALRRTVKVRRHS